MNRLRTLFVVGVAMAQMPIHSLEAAHSPNVRQALQEASSDIRIALEKSGISSERTISVLPLAGDPDHYVEGLLKNAVTAAGLTYVEGRDDPFWSEVLAEVEWDERKGTSMLNESTIITFGRLKATQLLMYGVVRDAVESGNRVFVEIELHLSSIETKEHIWGGMFGKRFYVPGNVQGIVDLDQDVRQVLREAVAQGASSVKGSEKLRAVKTVALIPLAGDIDGYVKGLVENMLSDTQHYPKDLDVGTLAEARQLLRDQPQQADALLYGAVRDLSRKVEREGPLSTVYEIMAEVQLRIQSAETGDVLWSETLFGKAETVETQSVWSVVRNNGRYIFLALAALVVLVILARLFKAMTRPR